MRKNTSRRSAGRTWKKAQPLTKQQLPVTLLVIQRKDVVGVALDIFIKSMSTVANTLASLFSTITLIH